MAIFSRYFRNPRFGTLAFSALFGFSLLVSTGCKRDPSLRAEEAYTRAQQYLKENKPEAAIIELSRAIQAKHDMAKAHHDLAKLYLQRGNANEAFSEYSLSIRYNPQDYDAYQVVGELLLSAREFAKTKDIATQILSHWSDDRRGQSLLVESMMGLGDWDGAREMVEQSARETPQDARAQFDLAALLVHDKKWPEAESQLRLSWSLDPKIVVIPLSLAQLLAAQGNFKGAEQVLNRAAADEPKRVEPLFALANLYVLQRRLPEAEQTYKRIQAADSANPGSRVALGEFYLATRNLKAAESEFRRLTIQNPDDSVSWRYLADLLVALNQRDEARRITSDLLKKDAKDWQALTLLGRLDLDEGKPAPAEQELDRAKAAKPDSAIIHFQLARLYLQQGKTNLAKLALGEALRYAPYYAPARTLQGAIELRAGQADLAVRDLSAALQQAPAALEPNLMISQAYAQRGEFNLAESTLQRMLDQSNTPASQAMTLQTLALVKFQQKRFAEAIPLAVKSLDLGLYSPVALRIVGFSYLAQKRPDQALESVASYANKAAQWASGQEVLGEVASQAGRLDAAERAYQKELEIQSNSPNALFGLGDIYERQRQYDKAQDFFRRFSAAQPSNGLVHLRLGILAERAQDFALATAEYQKAVSLDPSNGVAKNNLAWLYAEHNGDLDTALSLAREARSLLPGEPSVADTLGWIFLKKDMPDSALPLLKECVAKNPASPTYHYHLGMAYFQAGKKPEAAAQLRAALRRDASFNGSAKARETLDEISKSP